MRVVLHTILARSDGNGRPGEEIEVSDEVGKQLVDGGYATKAKAAKPEPKPKPEPEIESAAIEQDEKAVKPPPKRRRTTKK